MVVYVLLKPALGLINDLTPEIYTWSFHRAG